MPGRQNPTANIFQLVHDWLCDEKKGKWVLILDNVDNAGFLVEARRTGQEGQTSGIKSGNLRLLVSYLPQCPHGSILITTRTKLAALQLVEDYNLVAVEPMDKVDAVTLLEKKLRMREDNDIDGKNCDVSDLAVALEYMPLAIVQAAAYISQRAPRCSVSEYLDKFRKSDREKTSLLDNKAGYLRRDQEAMNFIIITWHILFEHIRQSRPSAADLLSLMIKEKNQQRIWSRLVQRLTRLFHRKRVDREGHERDEKNNRRGNTFEDDLLVLRNYAFISVSEIQLVFEMHALVQLAMRTWLEAKGDLERWRQYYCKILSDELPTGEYENWARCQELFLHAELAAAQEPKEQDSLLDWASVLYNAAWYAWRIGKGVEAEAMSVQAMKVRMEILGSEHNNTLAGMTMMGLVYNLNGRWDVAEELFVQVMETRKKKLGADHPDTLTSMANLASTYWNQGRFDAAKELDLQVMETSKKKLGADHPDTLNSMANLAWTWKSIGKETEAVKLMKDCIIKNIENFADARHLAGIYDEKFEIKISLANTDGKHKQTISIKPQQTIR
ncbi:hypothetical protein IFR05_009964 [Cadophora sp. M221]|nr:hypothetical protein IFR05_009964 [Cadophora sp. M221]